MKHGKVDINDNLKNHGAVSVVIAIIVLVFFVLMYPVARGKFTSFKVIHVILMLCIFAGVFFLWKELQQKQYKLERIFIIIALMLGTAYTLLIPPGLVPDEWVHMYSTFSLSSQVMGIEMNDKVTMKDDEVELYNREIKKPSNEYYNYVYNNLISISTSHNYTNINVRSASITTIFGYFPGVIGVTVARIIHLGPITTFYIGRLCNFVFYLLLTYMAIKTIPFGKLLLFTIALLPMSCHQMCSLSYDAIINSSCFFAISYGMFFVYQSRQVTFKDIIYYILCSLLLIINKGSAYVLILMIPILAKYFNPNSEGVVKKTKMILILLVVFAIVLLGVYLLIGNPKHTIRAVIGGGKVSWAGVASYTLDDLINDIPATIILIINTLINKGGYYINSTIGSLMGWLSITIPDWIINSWIVILLVSVFSEKSNDDVFTRRHKILYFSIALGTMLLIMLAMALAWTPKDYPTIEGVQGRYFIPILFLLLICLQNKRFCLTKRMIKFEIICILMMSIITIGNLMMIVL